MIPLIVLAVGLVPVRFGYIWATYGWLGAAAIWSSFPVTSLLINLASLPLSTCRVAGERRG